MNQTAGYSLSYLKICKSGNFSAPHFGTVPIQGCFRVLLLQTPNYKILFDASPGGDDLEWAAQRATDKKVSHALLNEMASHDLSPKDITHIVLSHLHYSSVGGILEGGEDNIKNQQPVFDRAKIFVSRDSYERARMPHSIDIKHYIPGISDVLENSADLTFVSHGGEIMLDDVRIELHETWGHSPGMILSDIHYKNCCIITGADLLPKTRSTDLTSYGGFDRCSEQLIDEKKALMDRAIKKNAWIFYPNDLHCAYSKIIFDQNRYLSTGHTNRLPD